ncbi:MAG: hypothetical protein K5767_06860 [Clostridia bacterium]|nr:hypothetical protein [Clostridia bacterium]
MGLSVSKKTTALGMIVTLLVCCLTGCGAAGTAGGSAGAEEIAGSQEVWGNLSVLVPEDMYLTGGSVTDEEDPDALWIQDKNDQFKYYIVSVVTEEQLEKDVKQSMAINSGETPEPLDLDGHKWQGMTYTFNDKPGFQVGAEIDGIVYEVSGYGYDLEDERTRAVLASLKKAA